MRIGDRGGRAREVMAQEMDPRSYSASNSKLFGALLGQQPRAPQILANFPCSLVALRAPDPEHPFGWYLTCLVQHHLK